MYRKLFLCLLKVSICAEFQVKILRFDFLENPVSLENRPIENSIAYLNLYGNPNPFRVFIRTTDKTAETHFLRNQFLLVKNVWIHPDG